MCIAKGTADCAPESCDHSIAFKSQCVSHVLHIYWSLRSRMYLVCPIPTNFVVAHS